MAEKDVLLHHEMTHTSPVATPPMKPEPEEPDVGSSELNQKIQEEYQARHPKDFLKAWSSLVDLNKSISKFLDSLSQKL